MANCFLLFIGVLSLFSTSSHSLSCIECKDTSDSCTGASVTCPKPDQVCQSIYTLTSVAGIPITKMILRDCGDRAACNHSGSISLTHSQTQSSSSCCYSDGCTPEKPVLPPIGKEKNGVSCRACMSTMEETCQKSGFIQCTGKEVKCISMTARSKGSFERSRSYVRGCATKELCEVSHAESSIGDITITTDVTCSDGCAALHLGLSLLLLTIGLILKNFLY